MVDKRNTLNFDSKYKECPPNETIQRIECILKEHKINILKKWNYDSVAISYSVRIYVENTNIASNGKGVTKEFALASGLAELMEDLQNIRVNIPFRSKYLTSIDKQLDRKDILDNPVSKVIKMKYGTSADIETSEILSDTYFSLRNQKDVLLPLRLLTAVYGSNGMCAGNTLEEALVQGFSEILERHVYIKVMSNAISYSEIDLNSLNLNYEIEKRIFSIGKAGFDVKIFNFTNNYPLCVVGLLISKKGSKRFGFKMGCHADIFIAIERTITEATQGSNLETFCTKNIPSKSQSTICLNSNISNLLDYGIGYLPDLKNNSCSLSVLSSDKTCFLGNRKLLSKVITYFLQLGYDILIKDASILGFPSYSIIIPGFSEVTSYDEEEKEFLNSLKTLRSIIQKPSLIKFLNPEKICGIILKVIQFKSFATASSIYERSKTLNFPLYKSGSELLFLVAHCFATVAQYEQARKIVKLIISQATLGHEEVAEITLFVNTLNSAKECGKYKNYFKNFEWLESKYPDDDSEYKGLNDKEFEIFSLLNTKSNLFTNDDVKDSLISLIS